jgi:hypothetical protein
LSRGKPRHYEVRKFGTHAGTATKRVLRTYLCDQFNDGQFPYYKPMPDGGSTLACPHDIKRE